MAALVGCYQSPANADNSGLATGKYIQHGTAEASIFVDLGFVPRRVTIYEVGVAGWEQTTWMAAGESHILASGLDLAANGITICDTADDGLLNGAPDDALTVAIDDHVIRDGVATEITAANIDQFKQVRGFYLGTSVDGGNSAVVIWVAER